MFGLCRHEWEILSETTTISRIAVLRQQGITEVHNLHRPANRKLIQLVTCKKCGKLKRFVEDI